MLKTIIEKSIWLYVLLLPLQTVFIFDEKMINGAKWQYGTGVFYATEILLIAILLMSLGWMLKSKKIEPQNFFTKENLPQKMIVACLWLLIAWSGLSIFWSAEKSAAFYLWFKLLEVVALFLVVVSLNIDKNKILWPLSLTTAAQGLLAFWQFITQSIVANKWLGITAHEAGRLGDIVIENSDGRWLRAYGTFNHPNILGGFCVFGLLASLELSRSAEKNNRIVLMAMAMLSALGIFFSFSRSAWLAAVIAVTLMTIKSIKDKKFIEIKLLVATVLLIISVLPFSYNLIVARNNFSNRLEQISINERSSQIVESFNIIKSSPITGIGINNYTAVLHSLNPKLQAYLLQPVHNLYLLISAELGIIGLLIFLSLIILLFAQKRNRLDQLAWLLPLLTIGLFDHYLWTQYAGIVLFWVVLTKIELSAKISR